MSRLGQIDILLELIDLSHDVMADLRQQLAYYRASVYKNETAGQIRAGTDNLRMIVALMGDEMLIEPFSDHDAEAKAGVAHYVPGECSFSSRLTRLLASLDDHLQVFAGRIKSHAGPSIVAGDLTSIIVKNRQRLLEICPHGSRKRAFFQAI